MDLKLQPSLWILLEAKKQKSCIFKFLQNGISGNLLNILSNFLSNIKQTFVLKGQTQA